MRAIQASPHRPMHIEIPGWWYFLAARTIDGKGIFSGEKKMKILQDVIAHAQRLYDAKIYGYILWSNHYHMILSFDSEDLAHFVRNIHSYSSQKASIYDATPGRRVWYQYWDRLLRIQYSLGDLYRRVSYIMHNPNEAPRPRGAGYLLNFFLSRTKVRGIRPGRD